MALVTYILLCGLAAGQQGSWVVVGFFFHACECPVLFADWCVRTLRFHPEQLYVAGWTSLAVIFSELIFTRLGCYFLNIPFEASMLDLVSYAGYKYVCIIVTDLVTLLHAGRWLFWIVFLYTGLSVGFFLVSFYISWLKRLKETEDNITASLHALCYSPRCSGWAIYNEPST